jgi:hypothetical protein
LCLIFLYLPTYFTTNVYYLCYKTNRYLRTKIRPYLRLESEILSPVISIFKDRGKEKGRKRRCWRGTKGGEEGRGEQKEGRR